MSSFTQSQATVLLLFTSLLSFPGFSFSSAAAAVKSFHLKLRLYEMERLTHKRGMTQSSLIFVVFYFRTRLQKDRLNYKSIPASRPAGMSSRGRRLCSRQGVREVRPSRSDPSWNETFFDVFVTPISHKNLFVSFRNNNKSVHGKLPMKCEAASLCRTNYVRIFVCFFRMPHLMHAWTLLSVNSTRQISQVQEFDIQFLFSILLLLRLNLDGQN